MATKIELSLAEKIDRARDGRSQTSIIAKMNERGCDLNDVKFSRKKFADEFTDNEIKILSEILETDLSK